MVENDFSDFSEMWIAAYELAGKVPTQGAIQLAFELLVPYDLSVVRKALIAHMRDPDRGRYAPKPADVIAKISLNDGRPGAEEAWSMCPLSEDDSAWMSGEMSIACAAAAPLISRGDLIAGRKAFIETYEWSVLSARAKGERVRWWLSAGHRASTRHSPQNETQAIKYLEAAGVARPLLEGARNNRALAEPLSVPGVDIGCVVFLNGRKNDA